MPLSHSGAQAESQPTAPSDKHLPSSISLNVAQTPSLLHVQKKPKKKTSKPPDLYWDKE